MVQGDAENHQKGAEDARDAATASAGAAKMS